ncbi:hypothetical protein [Acuticoccus sp.]|uniref:hypothetical protein n=1 Tax=Acuticoccus sp. TaxID=1904378 RepID=UPI003B51ADF0
MRLAAIISIAGGLGLAACVSGNVRPAVDGNWASDDGVFVATFQNGAFTSRLTSTGETVVADGRYNRTPSGLALAWTSIAANEQRGASCRFASQRQLVCSPSAGEAFSMTRVA